jgi:hypothetical protein
LHYRTSHFRRFGRAALAAWLVGMILLLDAMAAAPALHKWIHKDAGRADHQCAVTMFAHGKIDSAPCEVAAVAPRVWIEPIPSINFLVFSAAIQNLPHGRAPPASVSSQA